MTVYIKYFSNEISKIEKMEKGDWIDLRSHLAPRSSTYKNFGILVPNSPGIIDNSYCGEKDEWKLPVLAVRDTEIFVNDRICQFRLVEKQPVFVLEETMHLSDDSRGGFGSTGRS